MYVYVLYVDVYIDKYVYLCIKYTHSVWVCMWACTCMHAHTRTHTHPSPSPFSLTRDLDTVWLLFELIPISSVPILLILLILSQELPPHKSFLWPQKERNSPKFHQLSLRAPHDPIMTAPYLSPLKRSHEAEKSSSPDRGCPGHLCFTPPSGATGDQSVPSTGCRGEVNACLQKSSIKRRNFHLNLIS